MAVEAYDYLPSLETARAENNASVVLNHGRYHAELHSNLSGPEAEAASGRSEGANELSWSEAAGPGDHYVIQRSTELAGPDSIDWVPSGTTSASPARSG